MNKQINLSSLSKETQAAVKKELRLKQVKAAIDPYFLQTYEETKAWLDQARIKDYGSYTINPNTLVVDVRGTVNLTVKGLTKIPVQFGTVEGSFYCSHNKLTSLEGAPQKVGRDFDCSHNKLTSLKEAPKEVGGGFFAHRNKLTSLEGAPQKVGGDFFCYVNKLTSLKGAPKEVGGDFIADGNPALKTLEGIGNVRGNIYPNFLPKKVRDY